jgi:hypothetical protein
MAKMQNIKIALVHDYLKEYGGAERVLEAMHEIWPDAPIYTAFVDYNKLGPHAERIKKWDIRTSWVQKVWPVKKLHSPLRFITPWVWRYFDFSEYDVVITSSAWYIPRGIITHRSASSAVFVQKQVLRQLARMRLMLDRTLPILGLQSPLSRSRLADSAKVFSQTTAELAERKPIHICYMHTPPRHLYGYETASKWKKYWLVRVYGELINHFLRIYDYNTARRVDFFIANSKETQRRINKFYRRESTVIYPPVETEWVMGNGEWDKTNKKNNTSRITHHHITFVFPASRGQNILI